MTGESSAHLGVAGEALRSLDGFRCCLLVRRLTGYETPGVGYGVIPTKALRLSDPPLAALDLSLLFYFHLARLKYHEE